MKKKAAAPAAARKQLFRATAGLSLDEQLAVAAQLHASGANVLQRIDAMKKTTKQQKRVTKANSLKFDWLQEHRHLKTLEESCSKELESLLLRMYNDACTDEALVAKKAAQRKSASSEQPADTSDDNDDSSNNNDDCSDVTDASVDATAAATEPPTSYARDLEELLKLEQAQRLALLQQVASEREQQLAMKQLLGAIKETQRDVAADEDNQTQRNNDVRRDAQHLLFDAVVGLEMVATMLDDETAQCEQDAASAYSIVLASIREGRSSTHTATQTSDSEQRVLDAIAALDCDACPDELLRLEITDELRALHAGLESDLRSFRSEFVRAAAQPDAAGSEAAALDKTGGWCDADDARFVTVLRSHERKGKKSELLYDQLQTVLPHKNVADLRRHAMFHHHLRFFQDKCRNRSTEFERRHNELLASAHTRLQLAIQTDKDRQAQAAQLAALQQTGAALHARVAEWRVAKDARARIEQQQLAIAELLAQQQLDDDALEWRKRLDKQRRAVDDYKRAKMLDEIADEQLSDDAQRAQEAERAAQSIVNAKRVQFRHDEYQRKLEAERREQQQRMRDDELRRAKLDALKDETPYAQIIAGIVPDPERTRQETAAFRANVEAAQDDLPVHEAGLFPRHGYDCDTLFKNARFKLGLALRHAGLHTTEYARQAIANIKVANAGAYRHHVAQATQLW